MSDEKGVNVAELGEKSLSDDFAMFEYTAEEEREVVRKVDFLILPLMMVAYMLQYWDKSALNSSSILGIIQDLHLTGSQYSWTSSIFYFGFLSFSYPVSLIFAKFPLAKSLSIMLIIWSMVLICHAATKNFTGLMIARFFLGALESSISPGFSLITSLWYRKAEQPWRHGLWFCGNSLSLTFGSLVAYGIAHITGKLAPWQWIFIIFGLLTFVWGVVMLIFLPDNPQTAKFLNEKGRQIATRRMAENRTGYKTNKINRPQILAAFTDSKTWLLCAYTIGNCIPNGGLTTFSAIILKGFGFTTFKTLLMGMPAGAVLFVGVLVSAFLSSKIKNSRCIIMVIGNLISIIGCALVYGTKPIGSRYAGILIMGMYSCGMPISFSMISSNIGGFTKRATVSALLFVSYCAGNIIGPQIFFERESPRYQSGFLGTMICLVFAAVAAGLLAVTLWRENARRDAKYGPPKLDERPALLDITDKENTDFRYVY